MTFKSPIWYPIALVLSVVNLVAMGVAMRPGEQWEHAGMHAALALVFGFWAQRLRKTPGTSDEGGRLEALEDQLNKVQRDLVETQERLDFAERLLAKGQEPRRAGPDR
jgi:hypothetical protein